MLMVLVLFFTVCVIATFFFSSLYHNNETTCIKERFSQMCAVIRCDFAIFTFHFDPFARLCGECGAKFDFNGFIFIFFRKRTNVYYCLLASVLFIVKRRSSCFYFILSVVFRLDFRILSVLTFSRMFTLPHIYKLFTRSSKAFHYYRNGTCVGRVCIGRAHTKYCIQLLSIIKI